MGMWTSGQPSPNWQSCRRKNSLDSWVDRQRDLPDGMTVFGSFAPTIAASVGSPVVDSEATETSS